MMASLPKGAIQKLEPWDGARPYMQLYFEQADAQLQATQRDNALANPELANISNMINLATSGGYKQSSAAVQTVPAPVHSVPALVLRSTRYFEQTEKKRAELEAKARKAKGHSAFLKVVDELDEIYDEYDRLVRIEVGLPEVAGRLA